MAARQTVRLSFTVDKVEVVVRNVSAIVFPFIHDGTRTSGNHIRPLTVSFEAGKAEAILGQSLCKALQGEEELRENLMIQTYI